MQKERTKVARALRKSPPVKSLRVMGWVRTVRASKKVAFIELNDGSCFDGLQVVVEASCGSFEDAAHLTTGSAVEVVGELVESPAKGQSVELKAAELKVLGKADPSYPLQKKRHSFEYLREIAHLRARTNTFGAVFRIRSLLAHTIHRFFHDRGFVYLHSPIITASDCEGAGEMFRVTTLSPQSPPRNDDGAVDFGEDFFGRPAYLTVSGQLNAEAFALGLSEVYTFGPTFRAENSHTSRHAAEFWMVEPEVAFADLEDDCDLAEAFTKHCLRRVLDVGGADLEFFQKRIDSGLVERLEKVVESQFERITYTEAVARLEKSGERFEYPVRWGANLQAEHERWLTEKAIGRPTFVVDYPEEIKPFYMRRNDDGKTVAAMDLLVPQVGELIGGSQREERLDVLEATLRSEEGIALEDYQWYLDTRRFGTAPHAGFGVGFERLLMYATGMENIRDVIPFPRAPNLCRF